MIQFELNGIDNSIQKRLVNAGKVPRGYCPPPGVKIQFPSRVKYPRGPDSKK